jgi:hypothetical protein
MDHWALLMMKDPEPQSLQETPLPIISRRRHHARSPETYMLADYWYSSCATLQWRKAKGNARSGVRKARTREKRAALWRGNSKAPGLAINQIVSDYTSEEG